MNQIIISGYDYDNKTAFEDDIFNRKALAERLTSYIDVLDNGAVIAIDAQWGDGKTWFARNWHKMLKENERKTAYIDAFQQDYIEDPFLLIASELTFLLDNKEKDLRKTAIEVGKVLLPTASKATFKLAFNALLNKLSVSKEILEEFKDSFSNILDVTSKMIEDQIENYENDKKSFVAFKTKLKEIAEKSEKPIIIFVDELDRCNPVFAVNLIERLKHFFDVPNLVFVLLINKEQLENAIKGVYGAETKADAYLDKFINMTFNLPRKNSINDITDSHIERYLKRVFVRYISENNNLHEKAMEMFRFWACKLGFSLRNIERAFTLYALATIENQGKVKKANDFLAYLIILKIHKKDFFDGLLRLDANVLNKIAQFNSKETLSNIPKDTKERIQFYSNIFYAHINNNFRDIDRRTEQYIEESSEVYGRVISVDEPMRSKKNFLPNLLECLDLTELKENPDALF